MIIFDVVFVVMQMYLCIVKYVYMGRKCDLQWVEATGHKIHIHAYILVRAREG